MFKKLLTLMMVFALFTVHATAATENGLKAAFDELNYSLTVEWDQKDTDFYSAQMKKFNTTIRDLQAKGLTKAQLVEFAKTEVKDQRVAKDLETAFNMISLQKMSGEQASKYMMDTMKRSYSSGASWNGDVLVYAAIGLLIIAVAIAVASGSGGGSSSDDGYSCYTECGYTEYCSYYSCSLVYECYDVCY